MTASTPHPARHDAAVRRPWQTAVVGWLTLIGSTVSLLTLVPALIALDAGAVAAVTDADTPPSLRPVTVALDVVLLVILIVDVPASIALLRGSRTAYLYFVTVVWVGIVLVFVGAGLFIAAAGGAATGLDPSPMVSAFVIAFGVPMAFYIALCYLLWNVRTRVYFSVRSVEIRRGESLPSTPDPD